MTSAPAADVNLDLGNGASNLAGTAVKIRLSTYGSLVALPQYSSYISAVVTNAPAGGGSAITFGTWSGAALAERVRIDGSGNVGIGTANPQSKLAVNGTITTKEVVVTATGWSDYVFQPAYRLRPLTEVAAYIKENHRLPEIPSEAEVQQNGVGLGEMQAKLLAKIEELTLHMIQADERNNGLEQKNRELQERMARFEERGVNGGGK